MISVEEKNEILWDKVITPKQAKLSSQLKQVWDYRDLVYLFVKRDFVIYYKQTIFGPLWYAFQPICSTIMYMLIFGTLAQVGTDSIPQTLFYFSGTMLWTYFSGNLKEISDVFFVNKNIFGKVFFPRLVAPIATTISLLIKLGIQFILFIIIYLYYLIKGVELRLSVAILLFPLLIIWLGILSSGIGMMISAITTKYRDIVLIIDFVISLVMYVTPVVYPISEVPDSMKIIFYLNPASAPIELFRYCFFGICTISFGGVMLSLVMTLIFFSLGIVMFNKNARTFVDVI